MTHLKEADIDSPASDHLGDYVADHGDPYPATREAWHRATETLPGEAHRSPDEVRDDFTRYGASGGPRGQLVRQLAATSWHPNGFILNDGAQGLRIADRDPGRTRLVVVNHSEGPVYLAPTPTRSPGMGAWFMPAANLLDGITPRLELHCVEEVYAFTLTGFTAGVSPVHLQVLAERYDG